MSITKPHPGHTGIQEHKDNSDFYTQVMLWLTASFIAAAAGVWFIGPLIPQSLLMPLYFVALIALIASAFLRKVKGLSGILAIAIPTILGIILYPTLNHLVSTGAGDIVFTAAAGTAVIFGSMAIIGWTSQKSIQHWGGKLFAIVLGLIAISLLNTFILQMPILGLLISMAVLVIFSIYTFIDIQAIRDRSYGDAPPSSYALNVFLDIYNIFVSLLNILNFFRQ